MFHLLSCYRPYILELTLIPFPSQLLLSANLMSPAFSILCSLHRHQQPPKPPMPRLPQMPPNCPPLQWLSAQQQTDLLTNKIVLLPCLPSLMFRIRSISVPGPADPYTSRPLPTSLTSFRSLFPFPFCTVTLALSLFLDTPSMKAQHLPCFSFPIFPPRF